MTLGEKLKDIRKRFGLSQEQLAEISPVDPADMLSDMSPYYLTKKDGVKLLVNIRKWVLTALELPEDTNEKKFTYGKDAFVNTGKLKL